MNTYAVHLEPVAGHATGRTVKIAADGLRVDPNGNVLFTRDQGIDIAGLVPLCRISFVAVEPGDA